MVNQLPDIPRMRYFLYNFDKNENPELLPKFRRKVLYFRRQDDDALVLPPDESLDHDTILDFIYRSSYG